MLSDMTLVDHFAAHALAGLAPKILHQQDPIVAARYAYDFAAAMVAERERRTARGERLPVAQP